MRRKQKKKNKFLQVLNDYQIETQNITLPEIDIQNYNKIKTNILDNQKYLYIDINEDSGYRLMQECDSSEQSQAQVIGKACISKLYNLSKGQSETINHILKSRQLTKKYLNTKNLLNMSIEKAKYNIEMKKRNHWDFDKSYLYRRKEQKMKPQVRRGMDHELYQRYKLQSELEETDSISKKKQQKFYQNYKLVKKHQKNNLANTITNNHRYTSIMLPALRVPQPHLKSSRRSFFQ